MAPGSDEEFRYRFGGQMPGLDAKVTTALQDNFRRAATQKWVQTQTGLLIPKSLLTTKGDIITRDTSAPVRKGVGSDWSVLSANSGNTDGLEWAPKTVLSATQSGLVSLGTSWLTGCVITLTAGVWVVVGEFKSLRGWTSGAGMIHGACYLGDYPAANELAASRGWTINTPYERSEVSPTVVAVLSVATGATRQVGLWGTTSLGAGINFASGFRWDSGAYGAPSVITATRIA